MKKADSLSINMSFALADGAIRSQSLTARVRSVGLALIDEGDLMRYNVIISPSLLEVSYEGKVVARLPLDLTPRPDWPRSGR